MKQIWAKDIRDEMNVTLVFSYGLTVERGDLLKVASNVPFRLNVDGEMISYGPRRKAHGHAAINEYCLDAYAGKNIQISVECVSYRADNFYIVNQPPFFAAEIERDGKIIADSYDFDVFRDYRRLQRVQRFSYQRGFIEAYVLGKDRGLERVEADGLEVCKLSDSCVPYPVFREISAEHYESGSVVEKQSAVAMDDSWYNRNGIQHYAIEEQEYRITAEHDKFDFIKGEMSSGCLEKSYNAYRLPVSLAGFIAFDAEVSEDANVMVVYDEIFSGKNRDEINPHRLHRIALINYKLAKGSYHLQAFEPDQVQCIRIYAITGKAKISNVRLITYQNEEDRIRFKCNDQQINKLFDAAINSFKPNAVDVLTDCASRERAGWLGDSFFNGRSERLITGNNKIEKNLLESYRDYEARYIPNLPDGMLPMCYPSDHRVETYIPNWCMWLILEVEDYLRRTGDRRLVDELRDKLIAFVDHELGYLNSDGLLENIEGWVFLDWSRANELVRGVNYPTNMMFSAAMKAIERLYGEHKYADIVKKMDLEIVKQSYNGEFFVDNATRDESGRLVLNTEWTEACQYYAFYFGYADRQRYPKLYDVIFNEIHDYTDVSEKYPRMSRANTFIGLFLREDYLCRLGEYKKVLSELKSYFIGQAEYAGTLWEYVTPHASCCHCFCAILVDWIIQATLGVKSVSSEGVRLGDSYVDLEAEAVIPHGDKLFSVSRK